MSAGGGFIEMELIVDSSTKKMYNLVKLINNRYLLELEGDEVLEITHNNAPTSFKALDEYETIANERCQKLLVNFENPKSQSFFYVGKEFNVLHPNWYNPFHDLEGILIDYQIEQYGINMRLKASKIIFNEVDNKEFDLDPSFKKVNKKDFDLLVTQNLTMLFE